MSALNALARKIRLALGRGVIHLIDDGQALQRLQLSLLHNEVRDDVRRYQEYGLSSHPKKGTTAIAGAVGGNRNHLVVLLVDGGDYRKHSLAEGEVVLYAWEGDYIKLKNGREIEIVSGSKVSVTAPEVVITAGTKVTITSPNVEMSGNLKVTGTIEGGTVKTSANVSLGTHKHPANNTSPTVPS